MWKEWKDVVIMAANYDYPYQNGSTLDFRQKCAASMARVGLEQAGTILPVYFEHDGPPIGTMELGSYDSERGVLLASSIKADLDPTWLKYIDANGIDVSPEYWGNDLLNGLIRVDKITGLAITVKGRCTLPTCGISKKDSMQESLKTEMFYKSEPYRLQNRKVDSMPEDKEKKEEKKEEPMDKEEEKKDEEKKEDKSDSLALLSQKIDSIIALNTKLADAVLTIQKQHEQDSFATNQDGAMANADMSHKGLVQSQNNAPKIELATSRVDSMDRSWKLVDPPTGMKDSFFQGGLRYFRREYPGIIKKADDFIVDD